MENSEDAVLLAKVEVDGSEYWVQWEGENEMFAQFGDSATYQLFLAEPVT